MQEQNRASFRRMQEVQVIAIRHFFFRKLRRNVRTATQRDFSSPLIPRKREKSWKLQKISPFDVILKEKEQLLHFNRMLFQFAESWRGNNFVFQKLLDYESISGQSIFFLREATKILTDNEAETFLDQMIWFWDPDFFKAKFVHVRPTLFIREQIIQCHYRDFFVYC